MKIREITLIGIFSAITYVATSIHFFLPLASKGGLVHLGTPVIIITALLFGPRVGGLSAAIGMTIFDLVFFPTWAPITFIARILMGYIIGILGYQQESLFKMIGAVLAGSAVMIIIYYVGEVILYHNLIAPLLSIPGDFLQVVLGIVIGLPVVISARKYLK